MGYSKHCLVHFKLPVVISRVIQVLCVHVVGLEEGVRILYCKHRTLQILASNIMCTHNIYQGLWFLW